MKEFVFGIVAGIIASLGMGGGSVLIMLLSIFTNFKQHLIQGTNLIFFIPTAIIASFYNYKNKIIDFEILSKLIIFGSIGAIIGAKISFRIENNKLKKYFGYFLLIIAILELYEFFRKYIKKTKEHNNSK